MPSFMADDLMDIVDDDAVDIMEKDKLQGEKDVESAQSRMGKKDDDAPTVEEAHKGTEKKKRSRIPLW
jgi:hypothetical protein